MGEWNPNWVAFLSEKGLSPEQADLLERPERISLNCDFMSWNLVKSRFLDPKRPRP